MAWFRMSVWIAVLTVLLPARLAAQKPSSSIDLLVDRITAREHREVETIRRYKPIIETYIQDVRLDKQLGAVPVKDHYFIGVADLAKGEVLHSLETKGGPTKHLNPKELIQGSLAPSYVPAGFLEMAFIDPQGFNRHHYTFEYIHREFLGNVRCLVFDVTPAPNSGNGRFRGRIWVEDQQYTIIRFSGVFEPVVRQFGFYLHFDSWRENVGPNLWVPAYIYNGEEGLSNTLLGHVSEKSQTRLWGYGRKNAVLQEEFSEINVESTNVTDEAEQSKDSTPLQQQDQFVGGGADSALVKLEHAGLVAPAGDVEKMLNTVVNNLEVTNGVDIQPEIRCRVLLASTLESSSMGHTILISRGLLDVLPDEPSLAAILAHEIAHILLGRTSVPNWAFADQLIFPDEESLQRFSFTESEDDEDAASQKALEMLKQSPYKDRLASAALFLRALDSKSKELTALISPHLRTPAFFNDELLKMAPPLDPTSLEQVAALPLGSRIKLDPWSDRLELLKNKPVQIASSWEKMPFGLTPFYPYITRKGDTTVPAQVAPPKAPGGS
ncbi:MAG: M48 family metalloprotease [Candidatus Acidiferrales bacterium]